jgi:hypothetical protein
MNARKEIRDYLLASRMKHWLQIARCPIMNTKIPTWRARKNFWALVRKHPEIAARLGLSEVSVFSVRDEPGPESPASHKMSEAEEQPPAAAPTPPRDDRRIPASCATGRGSPVILGPLLARPANLRSDSGIVWQNIFRECRGDRLRKGR